MRMSAVVAVVVDDAARERGEDRQQGDYTKDLASHLFSPGANWALEDSYGRDGGNVADFKIL